MGKLEEVLDLIKDGVTEETEIAKRLGMTRREVEDIIKILESLGYVERVKFNPAARGNCPLRKRHRIKPRGIKVLRLTERAFSSKK